MVRVILLLEQFFSHHFVNVSYPIYHSPSLHFTFIQLFFFIIIFCFQSSLLYSKNANPSYVQTYFGNRNPSLKKTAPFYAFIESIDKRFD